MSLARSLVLLALLAACGPEPPKETGTSTGDVPGTTTTTATTGQQPDPITTTTTLAPTTTDPGTSAATTDAFDFIMPPDGGGCGPFFGEYGVRCKECDPWVQDCPAGEKCVPARVFDDGPWQGNSCVPLDPEPAHPGEPCTIEPVHTRLIDDCDLHSICLGIDPVTLGPVCVPLCGGAPDIPECPPGSDCLIRDDGALIACLPFCDPLVDGTCPEGQICTLNTSDPDHFLCLTASELELAPQFAPCDAHALCAAGLACVDAALAVECDPQQGASCCLPYCHIDAPACPGVMQTCQPFFPDSPPEWAHLGLCALP